MTKAPFMAGFDPKWKGPEDYILGITHEIWEERKIRGLTQYYGTDLIVRSPASVVQGNGGIIAATTATLAEFPDRELPGEDVICCPTGPDSFLSSHRLLCWATHLGPGMYGEPTGRKLTYRILADCWCAENAVHDEWLVRDQAAIVHQMGEELAPWVRRLIHREGGPDHCVKPFTPATDIAGPYTGQGTHSDFGEEFKDRFTEFYRTAQQKNTPYAPEVLGFFPSHSNTFGTLPTAGFWTGLHDAMPDAKLTIHHLVDRVDTRMPRRIAMRWSLDGKHSGPGRFGTASGANIHIMGISHFEFSSRGVCREYTLIDDTAVWKQILLATGDI